MAHPSTSVAAHKRKRDAEVRDTLGSWIDLADEKLYEVNGARMSHFDIMLRKQYNRAMDGKLRAIRFMMHAIDANLEARGPIGVIVRRSGNEDSSKPREWTNADLALLLLGIAAIDDSELEGLHEPLSQAQADKLRYLHPTHIEQWVIDACLEHKNGLALSDHQKNGVLSCSILPDRANVAEWDSRKAPLLRELVRLRAPRCRQFKPGVSGNPKGRPKKKREAPLPYDDFLMEATTFKVGDKVRSLTRLDALMSRLVMEANRGNDKIADLIMGTLMRLRERAWKDHEFFNEIIRS